MKSRTTVAYLQDHASLPTRECGLKYFMNYELTCGDIVTPYAGVWIEILTDTTLKSDAIVTPYAGVWIEILRERGVGSGI